MSYRLDEGKGRCTYHIGVEDDGCHSLLDYPAVSESAWILESIARSLNAVVLQRKMIQNEIECSHAENDEEVLTLTKDRSRVIVVDEPPVLARGDMVGEYHCENEDEKEDKADVRGGAAVGESGSTTNGKGNNKKKTRLCTEEGSYTRCELVIQRVETHLLDPSPLSLSALSRVSSFGEGVDGAMATTDLRKLAGLRLDRSASIHEDEAELQTSSPKEEEKSRMGSSMADDSISKPISVEETLSSRNIRVAVVGNVDAGKSTLIGTLTTSFLDDGRGSSRTAIMKHRHEIESGRTSTSSSHLLGFRHSGETIAGCDKIRSNKMKSEDEIARSSYRIITLMDLAGHEKYLKTTIHGVSSGMADYGLILVNSRHPPTHMTQHHLNLCCTYGIPVVVVFTKIDGCPDHALDTSKKELSKLLKSPDIGKKPFAIKTEQDVTTCIGKLHTLAPTIDISCVTGEGLDLLRKLLFALPKRRRHEKKVNRPFEFLVDDVFSNVPGVGSVVSGFVNAGELTVGNTQVYIGPTDDGTFLKTVAKSAHIARINTTHVTAGQSATLAFSLNKEMRKKLRRGMVVVRDNPTSTKVFDAEICVLKGEGTTIRKSYQAYVHVLNVRQTAFARNIEIVNNNALGLPPSHCADSDGIVLRPGSRAKVCFEFAKRPEYIRPGMRMLFRDGRVRGVGIITGIPAVEPVA
jgi:elongation factor 1-alpha